MIGDYYKDLFVQSLPKRLKERYWAHVRRQAQESRKEDVDTAIQGAGRQAAAAQFPKYFYEFYPKRVPFPRWGDAVDGRRYDYRAVCMTILEPVLDGPPTKSALFLLRRKNFLLRKRDLTYWSLSGKPAGDEIAEAYEGGRAMLKYVDSWASKMHAAIDPSDPNSEMKAAVMPPQAEHERPPPPQ